MTNFQCQIKSKIQMSKFLSFGFCHLFDIGNWKFDIKEREII